MAIGDYWELAILGVDGLIVYSLYKAYKRLSSEAEIIDKTPLFMVGKELQSSVDLTPDKCLPYVSICGVSKISNDSYLGSANSPHRGLIHESSIIEHKSTKIQGFWTDVTRKVFSSARACKFGIASPEPDGSAVFIEIQDPLSGEHLLENLPIIFRDFQPSNNGFLNRSIDVLFGEVVRGYEFTERMLHEGTPLLGIGKVCRSAVGGAGGKPGLRLSPPDLVRNRFILTTLTKPQLVDSLRGEAHHLRYTYLFSLALGAALAGWLAYKFFKRNKAWILRLRGRTRQTGTGPGDKVDASVSASPSLSSPETGDSCSVCLIQRKNVVLMPCRHLTVCSACSEALPQPKRCPVCRTFVKESVPVFIT